MRVTTLFIAVLAATTTALDGVVPVKTKRKLQEEGSTDSTLASAFVIGSAAVSAAGMVASLISGGGDDDVEGGGGGSYSEVAHLWGEPWESYPQAMTGIWARIGMSGKVGIELPDGQGGFFKIMANLYGPRGIWVPAPPGGTGEVPPETMGEAELGACTQGTSEEPDSDVPYPITVNPPGASISRGKVMCNTTAFRIFQQFTFNNLKQFECSAGDSFVSYNAEMSDFVSARFNPVSKCGGADAESIQGAWNPQFSGREETWVCRKVYRTTVGEGSERDIVWFYDFNNQLTNRDETKEILRGYCDDLESRYNAYIANPITWENQGGSWPGSGFSYGHFRERCVGFCDVSIERGCNP